MRLPHLFRARRHWAIVCAWLVACHAVANPAGEVPTPIGQTLRDVPLLSLNGADRQLASFRGRRLIINVWASWCSPCRAEAASLERLAWSDAGSTWTIIGISTDDSRSAAERWLKQSNATLSHFIDRNLALESMLGAQRIPLTVLVDEQGRVMARVVGARDWDSAEQRDFIERTYASFARRPLRRPP